MQYKTFVGYIMKNGERENKKFDLPESMVEEGKKGEKWKALCYVYGVLPSFIFDIIWKFYFPPTLVSVSF